MAAAPGGDDGDGMGPESINLSEESIADQSPVALRGRDRGRMLDGEAEGTRGGLRGL